MLHTDVKFGEVFDIIGQFAPVADNVAFKKLWDNNHGGVVLLSFAPGQALAEHLAPAELMVCVAEGAIDFTMIDRTKHLRAGEFMLVGEGVPHSVKSPEGAKVMLIKVKSDK